MKFKESAIAHRYLDGLTGIEIGGSAHNPFGLANCRNIDYTDDMDTVFKRGEIERCGEAMKVDIVAPGDDLPLPDGTLDYVVSSHVIEHFFDPIGALKEWMRVIRPGGYVLVIGPKSRALPGETRLPTSLVDLLERHSGEIRPEDVIMDDGKPAGETWSPAIEHRGHWSVWDLQDFLLIPMYFGWTIVEAHETDDKVGNGFLVLLRKDPPL
jgi:SAM-dependent methyltransferase